MTIWRWDQGRVLYFQFNVLRGISKVLIEFENKDINDNAVNDELRKSLAERTGLPFLPTSYKVNRNYSRVFQCALLACYQDKRLVVSDICKLLANDSSVLANSDSYLCEVVKRFRFPFPAFTGYDSQSPRTYPFCAIIKYLIALRAKGMEAKVSLDGICRYLIGNGCTGLEDLGFYQNLEPTDYVAEGDAMRQLREMLAFIGQLSFLKIFDQHLYLDIYGDEDADHIVNHILVPKDSEALQDKAEEFLQVTQIARRTADSAQNTSLPNHVPSAFSILDRDFTEGKRVRAQHLRIERSPLVRKFYMATHPEPVCQACHQHVQKKYPWVGYMLDIHHLLPLASAIKLSLNGTSLDDMVGLCPSCHKAIHAYYRKWLKANGQDDFRDRQQAMEVYLEAVRGIA